MADFPEPTGTDPAKGAAQSSAESKALMKKLLDSLRASKVPASSYVKVNTAGGAFVSGKTPEEVTLRFDGLHPGATGWIRRVGDLIGDPKPDDDDEMDETIATEVSTNSAKPRRISRGPGRTFVRK